MISFKKYVLTYFQIIYTKGTLKVPFQSTSTKTFTIEREKIKKQIIGYHHRTEFIYHQIIII